MTSCPTASRVRTHPRDIAPTGVGDGGRPAPVAADEPTPHMLTPGARGAGDMAEPKVVIIRDPPVYAPDDIKRAKELLARAYRRALIKALQRSGPQSCAPGAQKDSL